jgi:hypothetical protein
MAVVVILLSFKQLSLEFAEASCYQVSPEPPSRSCISKLVSCVSLSLGEL